MKRVCQAIRPGQKIECPERESGGAYCEIRGEHTGHGVSDHTMAHLMAGNGYSCDSIDRNLRERRVATRGPADALLVLQKLREASVRSVAREMGAPKSSVDRWLKILVKEGWATVTVWPSRRRTYAVQANDGS
jgi:hypothetical protein